MALCNKCNNNRCNGSCGKKSITRQIKINNNSIGRDGESAYDQWVRLVTTVGLDDPHNPGQLWPIDKTSVDDYISYNRGTDGDMSEYEYTEW